MNTKSCFASLLALLLFSGPVFGQSSESETKMKLEKAKSNKVDGDIDEEITNARMRSETGSKSKLSVSTTFNYMGGTIQEPFSKDRANSTNSPTPERVRLIGDIGARYRLSKNNSIQVGTGLSVVRPFHGMERTDVSTPFVAFNQAFATGKLQNSWGAQVSVATDTDDRDGGVLGTAGLDYTLAAPVGKTAWTVGLTATAVYTFHDKDVEGQVDYEGAAYPFAEYAFSDTYQFRTLFRPYIYRHSRAAEGFTFEKAPWTQSMGVSVVLSRDVYLYPNFQWRWEDWRQANFNFGRADVVKTTTVGLQANINIF